MAFRQNTNHASSVNNMQSIALPYAEVDAKRSNETPEDALLRALDGLDVSNKELFESALVDNTLLDINGQLYQGLDRIMQEFYHPLSLLNTTHFASNFRVYKDGNSADMSVKVLAQDYAFLGNPQAASQPSHVLSAFFHRISLVRPRGAPLQGYVHPRWRITHWRIQTKWTVPAVGTVVPISLLAPVTSSDDAPPSYTQSNQGHGDQINRNGPPVRTVSAAQEQATGTATNGNHFSYLSSLSDGGELETEPVWPLSGPINSH